MATSSLRIPFAFGTSVRFASSALADLARSSVGQKSLQESLADAIVRAPNAGRALPEARSRGELRVPVGSPRVTLSLSIMEPEGGVSPRGVVFVLHGIRDTKESMHGWGALLSQNGFRSVMVDLRGHGGSTGDTLSYGARESADLRDALDALEERGLTRGAVGVAGFSYGAAVAVQWAGLDPRVRAAVAVAPFSRMDEVVAGYLPLPLSPSFLSSLVTMAGARGGFDPAAASPKDAIRRSTAPLLLVHGTGDERIPAVHSERIRDARPAGTLLRLTPGASHRGVVTHAASELRGRLPSWFVEHLP
jgi:pimeloyl-ACP methyl ester carboxylesterase